MSIDIERKIFIRDLSDHDLVILDQEYNKSGFFRKKTPFYTRSIDLLEKAKSLLVFGEDIENEILKRNLL